MKTTVIALAAVSASGQTLPTPNDANICQFLVKEVEMLEQMMDEEMEAMEKNPACAGKRMRRMSGKVADPCEDHKAKMDEMGEELLLTIQEIEEERCEFDDEFESDEEEEEEEEQEEEGLQTRLLRTTISLRI